MSKNSTVELEVVSVGPVAEKKLLKSAKKGFLAVLRLTLEVGPDLLLSVVMSLVLLTALLASGGKVRFFQASLGLPILIVLFLIGYRTIARKFRPEMKTNVTHILRDWLPFLFVTFIYENLHDLSKYFMNIDIAGLLMKWDVAIFGVEPTLWAQKIYSPLLTDVMAFSYALYFLLPLVIMFFLSNRDDRPELRRMTLALTFAFLMGFVGYVLWPTSPPRYFIVNMFTDPVKLHGLWLYDALQAQWDNFSVVPCGAFPSLHVGISSVALLYAWKYRNVSKTFRVIWWLYIPFVTSLWFSTVYLRHHWVIDIFAGWFVAVVAYFSSEFILGRWDRWRRQLSR